MADATEIRILGMLDDEEEAPVRGAVTNLFRREDISLARGTVPVEKLEEQVSRFLAAMRQVVDKAPQSLGPFSLDTITVTAEVTATGSVSLLGTGAEVSGRGGLTFILNRRTNG